MKPAVSIIIYCRIYRTLLYVYHVCYAVDAFCILVYGMVGLSLVVPEYDHRSLLSPAKPANIDLSLLIFICNGWPTRYTLYMHVSNGISVNLPCTNQMLLIFGRLDCVAGGQRWHTVSAVALEQTD